MVFLVQKFIAKNKKKRLYLAQSSVNLYNCVEFIKACMISGAVVSIKHVCTFLWTIPSTWVCAFSDSPIFWRLEGFP